MKRYIQSLLIPSLLVASQVACFEALAQTSNNYLKEFSTSSNSAAHNVLVAAVTIDQTRTQGDSFAFKTNVVVDQNQKENARIEFEVKENYIQVIIKISENSKNDPSLWIGEAALVKAIQKSAPGSFFEIKDTQFLIMNSRLPLLMETMANAKAGSLTAQARLLEINKEALSNLLLRGVLLPFEQAVKEQIQVLNDKLIVAVEKAEKYQRAQNKALALWRKETNILNNYENMEMKLNDLVLANDRKGVRKMLEAYLPWLVMEPMEITIWKNWLDAIENPKHENSIVAFRGLNYETDKIQRTKDGKIGLLSTVLTANQGSYTRRLRSLVTNRVLNGDKAAHMTEEKAWINSKSLNSTKIASSRVFEQFHTHSKNPRASSFLSFTFSPTIAGRFSEGGAMIKDSKSDTYYEKVLGGVVAVKIDSRRMIPNLISGYTNEIELLAPLLVFPDEVLAFEEGLQAKKNGYPKVLQKVKELTGLDFAVWQKVKDADLSLNEKFLKDGFGFLKDSLIETSTYGKTCSSIFN